MRSYRGKGGPQPHAGSCRVVPTGPVTACRKLLISSWLSADRVFGHYAIRRYADVGVDATLFGDDWGEQSRMLISTDCWRAFFKPRYRRMFAAVQDGGALVYFHSDGWICDILDDLLEFGVDILNPQHHVMGTAECGRRLAGRTCVRSDLDRQHVLPFARPRK